MYLQNCYDEGDDEPRRRRYKEGYGTVVIGD